MRSLILYYTYHGNTQRIAERIHAAIGGDIARIDTIEPYTGDYDDVVAQGEREVKHGYLPPLKPMDIDLDRYDTIVLGTPVWWYTCSPAMRAFLTAHDLSGKTVYPFATNGGWLGRCFSGTCGRCARARHFGRGWTCTLTTQRSAHRTRTSTAGSRPFTTEGGSLRVLNPRRAQSAAIYLYFLQKCAIFLVSGR